ncbi:hypothetical protein B2J86_07615 [Acidovorax sp. SRB_14]|uniref:COG4315 family predicted lipoprotein n=1 Tax=unclassified Acidovorax TaxID=2684926 RepID=UPI00145F9B3D|nr:MULTISPECIES: hypothetical protein [unclassified Acidovorax]NMM75292.1 hypothetical protein [Acidovorax sp. SRB_24]NMM80800.1 hypothetical protein [Acidovorax sp. SRB_14]NMM85772.1 hypothetical protein [Rhodococcus sp. SRB_17]
MKKLSSLLVFAALATGYSAAQAQLQTMNGVLVGPNGMTLYTLDRDTAGKSTCNGPCATNWPPLTSLPTPGGADYGMIQRDDGTPQVTYKGKPLYYWSKDGKAGDMTGDGMNQVWHAAKP